MNPNTTTKKTESVGASIKFATLSKNSFIFLILCLYEADGYHSVHYGLIIKTTYLKFIYFDYN